MENSRHVKSKRTIMIATSAFDAIVDMIYLYLDNGATGGAGCYGMALGYVPYTE